MRKLLILSCALALTACSAIESRLDEYCGLSEYDRQLIRESVNNRLTNGEIKVTCYGDSKSDSSASGGGEHTWAKQSKDAHQPSVQFSVRTDYGTEGNGIGWRFSATSSVVGISAAGDLPRSCLGPRLLVYDQGREGSIHPKTSGRNFPRLT